jgi:pyruvate formate lyase activating enzyme
VTNGYMTPEALTVLIEAGLDAMNVDIKGDAQAVRRYCRGVDQEGVWEVCRLAKARGVHIEITTLIIPTVNDTESTLGEIAGRIAAELGTEVPWHATAYFPAYRFTAPPTPVRTLERAWEIGQEAGLEFVYVGNRPGHRYDDTYCPGCGAPLIRRLGFDVLSDTIRKGRCPGCGRQIAGVWMDRPARS